jgi:hypothetical protein
MATENRLYTFQGLLENGIEVKDKASGEVTVRKIGKILIPMIQRPYAQGRKSQASVRNKFLTDIFSTLRNPNVDKLELNFVYGTFVEHDADNNTFELLDGQQRLTTLFLLHFYFACQKRMVQPSWPIPEYLTRFTYQTRTTSTEFLEKLVKGITLDDKPSKVIRSAVWYSRSFDKDTTVDSMLRMLDSIDDFYYQKEAKPKYEDLDKLQFYVLELNGFGLTEELFIKMNARGLQLTPFENFKADLIGYMKQQERYCFKIEMSGSNMHQRVPYWMNFSSLMDSRWQDLFWERPAVDDYENSGSRESDIRFFRFIQRFLANKMITLDTKRQNLRKDNLYRFFADNTEVERHQGFEPYQQIIAYSLSLNEDIIFELEKVLNFLTDTHLGISILDGLKPSWEKELTWKPWNANGIGKADVGQRQMILLSAMTNYIEKSGELEDFSIPAYKQFMRITQNLVQSFDISGEEPQINLTRLLADYLNYNDGASLPHTWERPYETITSFCNTRRQSNRYLEAEAMKARLILDDEHWEDAFVEAESDPFMTGSCTFYHQKGMSIDRYRKRTSHVPMLFNAKGVADPFRKDYLLMRAVLCRNYDWSSIRREQWAFVISNDAANRYLKILTIWNDAEPEKNLFSRLLDCSTTDEMKNVIQEVCREDHELILRDDQWNKEETANLQLGYQNLYKETNMNVLAWLYTISHKAVGKAVGVWVRRDGVCSLYKGSVNNMLLTTHRNVMIPKVIEDTKDGFDFQYYDGRQKESLDKFRNYSGDDICFLSKGKLPNGYQLDIYFRADNLLRLATPNLEFAEAIYGNGKLKQWDSGSTVSNGTRAFFTMYGQIYYQALEIKSYEEYDVSQIVDILNVISNEVVQEISDN